MTYNQKYDTIIHRLVATAKTSPINSHKLAAVIITGTKLLSRPCANIHRNSCRGHFCGSLHAEAHAIIDYYGKDISYSPKMGWCPLRNNKSKKDIIVIRVNEKGCICISRPCCYCLEMMRAVDIRRVYYVDNNNKIVFEYVRDMISIHMSSVSRHIHSIKDNETYIRCSTNFFNNLLKTIFPLSIKRTNFNSFVQNNLSMVLPKYTYIIKTEKKINIVIILDPNNIEIIKAILID